MNDPDLEDARKAQQGDREAFGRLYARHADGLHTFVRRLCRNQATAEDLVHAAFFQALNAIGSFRGDSLFKTWVYQIAYYAWSSDRKKKSGKEVSLEAALAGDDPPELRADTEIPQSGDLLKGVAELPDDQRTAIELFYGRDMSIKDIAVVMGKSEANVKVLLFRARHALKSTITNRREHENG